MTTRLTITLIAQDAVHQADGFLQSVHGLWDELVVVDLGSTDGTAERFVAAGARVVPHPSGDDAAAARNAGLRHATGDWVLVLEPAERLSPSFAGTLRVALADPRVGAVWVRVTRQLAYGHRRDAWALRAWRNDPTICFERPVCEEATRSVEAMLASRGLRALRLEPPLFRPDCGPEDEARTVSLLEAQLAGAPDDLFSRWKLLELARSARDEPLWRAQAVAAADALALAGPLALAGAPYGGALVAVLVEGLFNPDSAAGLAFLEAWARRLQPSAPFFLRRGFFFEHQRRSQAAEADYRAALELSEGDPLALGAPHLGLARLALGRGEASVALRHGQLALDASPRDPEALLAVASLTRQLGGAAALNAWRKAHAQEHPLCPERDWALGEAWLSARDPQAAVAAFRRAAGVPPRGPAALRLAQSLLACGEVAAAERLATQLLPSEPEAGLGVLLFNLAAGRDTSLELDLSEESAHLALRQWVDALLESRQAAVVRAIHAHAKAVNDTFPWLSDYLRRKSA